MKSLFLTPLILLSLLTGYAQTGGAVSISDKGITDPVDYAMLDLNSDSKGVLIPRMSIQNMRNIKNAHDGLLVYVINDNNDNTDAEGFYYYDELRNTWNQWKREDPDEVTIVEPIGTIVAYTGVFNGKFYEEGETYDEGLGRIGTDMEGWALCNGNNGTPDLSARFVVGTKAASEIEEYDVSNPDYANNKEYNHFDLIGSQEYAKVGVSSQYATNPHKIFIKKENIPSHRHDVKAPQIMSVIHTHDINDVDHSHTLTRAVGFYSTECCVQTVDGGYSNIIPVDVKTPEIELSGFTGEIEIRFDPNSLQDMGKDSPNKLDNRPPFYVVAFIIKVGKKPYEEGYNPITADCSASDCDCFQVYDNVPESNISDYEFNISSK